MARKQTKLETIAKPHPQASILDSRATPAIKGDENEDLLCGGCGVVIGQNISLKTTERFMAPVQLLLKCAKCGAHNKIGKVGH